ncbi:MAG TPA: hypothetical protein VED59_00685, partial [Acidimicrobiales bacterium]|nr:hypothetical protein [Acidimicrobiales bacterium]
PVENKVSVASGHEQAEIHPHLIPPLQLCKPTAPPRFASRTQRSRCKASESPGLSSTAAQYPPNRSPKGQGEVTPARARLTDQLAKRQSDTVGVLPPTRTANDRRQ